MKRMFLMLFLVVACATTRNYEFQAPLDKGRITSNLGGRWGRLHFGVDIGAPRWTIVKSTARGRIVSVIKRDKVFGNRVEIYHPHIGLYSSYSHLQEIAVRVSQEIEAGETIGLVGSTGKSTGNHLHFEIYNGNGVFINPMGLINKHNFIYKDESRTGKRL